MVKIHEYQGKAILKKHGLRVPKGDVAITPQQAFEIAAALGGDVVIKAQVWTTSRAAQKLIRFAASPEEAAQAVQDLIGLRVGNFTVEKVLIEEKLNLQHEFYLGLVVDDHARAPVIIFSPVGGSGVEEIAAAHPDTIVRHEVNIRTGLRDFDARNICRLAGIEGAHFMKVSSAIVKLYQAARAYDARSAEINPLALTTEGDLIALDARFTIDDYAAFRHPDLEIEIAREFDHPPTPLERIAWNVEKDDYRGTFYFIQMRDNFKHGDGIIGFHGVGGGGSIMNMDNLRTQGLDVANFVDTSGNPPASKVYRAARIILSQQGIDGYYSGGSGVASQEQFHSARGLVKAFIDTALNIPAVIRIGGNREEQAIEILHRANGSFPAPVEAYGRDDTPDMCATRLRQMIDSYTPVENPQPRIFPELQEPYQFETVTGGTVTFDHAICRDCESKICIQTCVPQILKLENDVPVLNISHEQAKRGGCTECLACEVECYFLGNKGGFIHLPIHGLTDGDSTHANPD